MRQTVKTRTFDYEPAEYATSGENWMSIELRTIGGTDTSDLDLPFDDGAVPLCGAAIAASRPLPAYCICVSTRSTDALECLFLQEGS